MMAYAWEKVPVGDGPQVRRFVVPGGWLYQVLVGSFQDPRYPLREPTETWSAPCFVSNNEFR